MQKIPTESVCEYAQKYISVTGVICPAWIL